MTTIRQVRLQSLKSGSLFVFPRDASQQRTDAEINTEYDAEELRREAFVFARAKQHAVVFRRQGESLPSALRVPWGSVVWVLEEQLDV